MYIHTHTHTHSASLTYLMAHTHKHINTTPNILTKTIFSLFLIHMRPAFGMCEQRMDKIKDI
jgi:hypothetical protein